MAKETSDVAPTTAPGKSKMVKVRLSRAVAFEGVAVRPIVDAKDPRKITPVIAILPRVVAEGYSKAAVEILADAPDDAKIGVVAD